MCAATEARDSATAPDSDACKRVADFMARHDPDILGVVAKHGAGLVPIGRLKGVRAPPASPYYGVTRIRKGEFNGWIAKVRVPYTMRSRGSNDRLYLMCVRGTGKAAEWVAAAAVNHAARRLYKTQDTLIDLLAWEHYLSREQKEKIDRKVDAFVLKSRALKQKK